MLSYIVVATIRSTCDQEAFKLFWTKVLRFAESSSIEERQLPRRKKRPAHFKDGGNYHFHETPKEYYHQIYYQILDITSNCMEYRFDQQGYKIYYKLEQLMIEACTKGDFEDKL